METLRAVLISAVGLVLTGFAFIVAATFGIALIGFVALAAVISAAAVKISPVVRTQMMLWRTRTRNTRVWNDGRGVIIDA